MNFDMKAPPRPYIVHIAALDAHGGIGHKGRMPWHIREEQQFFRQQTTGHLLLMGRRTYESLGRMTLPERRIVVLSHRCPADIQRFDHETMKADLSWSDSLDDVFSKAAQAKETVYVCGGASVYAQTLTRADALILSRIPGIYACDAFYPKIPADMICVAEHTYPQFTVCQYLRIGRQTEF